MPTIRLQHEFLTDLLSMIQLHFETHENWTDWNTFVTTRDRKTGKFYADVPMPVQKLVLNGSDNYESIKVEISEDRPIIWNAKIRCLATGGMNREDAIQYIKDNNPFELELYYEEGYGLMGVDPEATEAGTIYSPYSKKQYS